MITLTPPDPTLTARVLGRVAYGQRLVGYRVRRRSGAIPMHLYSFREVVHLLNDKQPRIDLEQLCAWLDDAIGDRELSQQVSLVLREEKTNREQVLAIHGLMRRRLDQCAPPAIG